MLAKKRLTTHYYLNATLYCIYSVHVPSGNKQQLTVDINNKSKKTKFIKNNRPFSLQTFDLAGKSTDGSVLLKIPTKPWQWANMHNTRTLILKQLNEFSHQSFCLPQIFPIVTRETFTLKKSDYDYDSMTSLWPQHIVEFSCFWQKLSL